VYIVQVKKTVPGVKEEVPERSRKFQNVCKEKLKNVVIPWIPAMAYPSMNAHYQARKTIRGERRRGFPH